MTTWNKFYWTMTKIPDEDKNDRPMTKWVEIPVKEKDVHSLVQWACGLFSKKVKV